MRTRDNEESKTNYPNCILLNVPHAEGESVRSTMNGKKAWISRLVLRFWVGELDLRTTLRARACRSIVMVACTGCNQMGIVDCRDYNIMLA
jgi:hypothetical protein